MANDPYATLGVARTASEKEIKSAYRKLAKELHPDKNSKNPKATERFSEVTSAYDMLSDSAKRAQFDRGEIDGQGNPAGFGGGGFGGGGFGGQQGFDPRGFGGAENVDLGGIFEGLFGGRGGPQGFQQRAAPKGAHVQYRLAVSLTDAAILAAQRITLQDGKTIDLKLPAGLEDGTQMRLAGKGQPGHGGAGDALVTIAVSPHPLFRRDGDHLRIDLPITLDEAVMGAKVRVPTADGAVMLAIAPGSSSGKVLRLKGKGMSRKDGTRGDQLVELQIALPDPADPAALDLAKRLQGWRDPTPIRAKMGE